MISFFKENKGVFGVLLLATLLLTSVAMAVQTFATYPTIFVNGPTPASFPLQGGYMTANSGGTYFVNQKGSGGGGFNFSVTTAGGGLGTTLMNIDTNGAVHANFFTGLAFTANQFATAPSNCPAGYAPTGIDVAGNALGCQPTSSCVSADDCGELFFSSSQTSQTYTFSGTPRQGGCAGCYPAHPICTTSANGFQNTYLYPVYGGCGGSPCTLTLRAATVGVTGAGEYICRIR